MDRPLDLICLGRAAVDLYSEQLGAPLEDAQTLAKSLGGCAANVAVGAARLGLRVAMLTRVGDEHMGRFVRASLAAEGVDVSHVRTDPDRLTGLVLLGIRDRQTFPLVFYRERCADMGLTAADFDAAFIGSARALLCTGTHLSRPEVEQASKAAIAHARAAGTRVVLDLDYRPVLWGLTGHGLGEERFVAADVPTQVLQSVLPACDLVVGTEEELHIAGGSTDTVAALRKVRSLTAATIVLKRGAHGCVVFEGVIPPRADDGLRVHGFPVTVLNVLGAGNAFLGGFLRGWIRAEPMRACCRRGNAAGAFVVARHGCSPAMPTAAELDDFLSRADAVSDLGADARLRELHRVGTRAPAPAELMVLAFDHRTQLEDMAHDKGAPFARIPVLKRLIADAVVQAARRLELGDRAGAIIDDRWGTEALYALGGSALWLARPVEKAGAPELDFEHGPDVGLTLRSWPRNHVAKCLVGYHPDGDEAKRTRMERLLLQLQDAAFGTGHELLLEPIPRATGGRVDTAVLPRALERLYDIGLHPDWWKLPALDSPAAWQAIERVVAARDPHCRGIVILGLDAPEDAVAQSFRVARDCRMVKGFAVGRTVFSAAAQRWLAGALDDHGLVEAVAETYGRLVRHWLAR